MNPSQSLILVVDPYSTGCMVAQEISKRGYPIMAIWTKGFAPEMKSHIPVSCRDLTYIAQLDDRDGWSLDDLVAAIKSEAGKAAANKLGRNSNYSDDDDYYYTIAGCIAGGEAGVDMADLLSEKLGVLSNGTKGDFANRRDKKVQQDLVRDAGMRAVRQACGETFEEVEDFLKSETFPVVLKPTDSAGSDGVKLCESMEEAKTHFHHLLSVEAVNGGYNTKVLCQEFLRGKEYVIDHVSRNGVHKTMMVWVYDKRPRNGSQFVYFGMLPIDPKSEEAKVLIPYTRGVLDALGMAHGPSHGEAIMTKDGPCLVEMNCRAHGGDGNWAPLGRALTGGKYCQIEATAAAYLDEEEFSAIPDTPPSPLKAHGLEVNLVSYSKGKVLTMPGFDVIKKLPSFVWLSPAASVGSEVKYTVDLITSPGCAVLMNNDNKVLQKDLEFIRYLEEINGLFVYETKGESLARPTAATFGVGSLPPSGKKGAHRRIVSIDRPSMLRIMSQDRPELRGGLMKRFTTVDASKEVVVVVDPYSTGCLIVKEIQSRGFKVIALWTKGFSEEMKKHVPLSCGTMVYFKEVAEGDNMGETTRDLYKAAGALRIVACMCGGEAGVDTADLVSERLLVRTNGTQGAFAFRRDKKVQQELLKAAGMRSIRQAAGKQFSDVESFLQGEHYPVVLKPTDSAGTDGVKLCHDLEEAKEHFTHLLETEAVNGGYNTEVLCQEFLCGKEYVVDTVSRDGEHKTTAVWVYDKRPANGAAFVYFGMLPIDTGSLESKLLIKYNDSVLDALGMKNGAGHGEVILTPSGPCLVEMNCRAQGGDGNWRSLARALTGGYSQVEACVDAYLDKKSFHSLPKIPPSPAKAFGQEVILVSFAEGDVIGTPGYDEIKDLESFVCLETGVAVGCRVERTVDLLTGVGSAILLHEDEEVVKRDIAKIREMEKKNELFELKQSSRLMTAVSSLNFQNLNLAEGSLE
eukprot:CAMPEP_0172305252 /NCGR_PEP_ID=MMETSP1058-20130122/6570_1 /TAXON_ID=83371 /ORGANISM="Detonula confervacea, Strain CCMP 353" /LENGTH=965 /DNA_ID=CAMNT_0013016783 /DNA_START=201 /DNA_END=3098 /DNA_ORIENTATION=+